MPELPEVETLRRDLEPVLLNRTIRSIEVQDAKALTGIGPRGEPRRDVTAAHFKESVLGRKVGALKRRGKYLIIEFIDKTAVIIHLRMTGQLLLQAPPLWRVRFSFDEGFDLYFADRRRFGEVTFCEDWEKDPSLRLLGIEPANGNLSGEYLKKVFQGRKAPIHSILLSQKLVSGLGNIYVTEALYKAGLRPRKACGRIPLEKLSRLARSISEVLKNSIENRGYSMNTYVDALGKKGRSQLFSLAYGKGGSPCPRCETIFKRVVISGRGVVFCPTCQK